MKKYRFKTKKEFRAEFGRDWRRTGPNWTEEMDGMLGVPLFELGEENIIIRNLRLGGCHICKDFITIHYELTKEITTHKELKAGDIVRINTLDSFRKIEEIWEGDDGGVYLVCSEGEIVNILNCSKVSLRSSEEII